MNRAELIDRAAREFEGAGRGVVVTLMEDVGPRFVPIDEIKASLVEDVADPGILVGVIFAKGKCEPQCQAVYPGAFPQWAALPRSDPGTYRTQFVESSPTERMALPH